MTSRLIVLADAKVMGELRQVGDRVDFEYDTAWQKSPAAFPLSLSMPLARRRHPSAVVKPFLSNLLPDSENILSGWARRFHSSRNPFALLRHVGEDCAGAIQIVPPERRDQLLSRAGSVEWLSEADIAQRLRDLRRDSALGRTLSDSGQFSLAGAQAKTALCYLDGRWGVPSGVIPTTHILKPSTLEFDSYEANEHFCLELAGQLGLPRVRSDVRRFEDQVAIVVERYDRLAFGGQLLRLHQEDFCQALGVPPSSKYENEGGPSAVALAATVASGSSAPLEDLRTLRAAFIFNWLMVGTDAHAKNYSLLLGGHGQVRLAPLYDLSSVLPYAQIPFQKAKLAMKIGGKYRVRDIGKHEWQKHAVALKVDAEDLMGQLRGMLKALPDAASAVLAQCRSAGVEADLPERLRTALTERATRLQIEFGFAT